MIKRFIVPLILILINIILTIMTLNTDVNHMRFLVSIWGTVLLLSLYPLCEITFKTKLPSSLKYVYYFHIIISVYIGVGMYGYQKVSWLDLFAHGFFGFEGCLIAYLLLVKTSSHKKLNSFMILIFLLFFSIGCAAFWEMYEYLYDLFANQDTQNVYSSLAKGLNPVTDTMGDMLITLLGVLLTFVGIYIDKLLGFKIIKKLNQDFSGDYKNNCK